mgnify:FL=1
MPVKLHADPTGPVPLGELPVREMVHQALAASLYYDYDRWFEVFNKNIRELESAPPTTDNRLDLTKFYFSFSGLLGELTRTLAFTSKYKIQSVEDEFIYYSKRTKDTAHEVLKLPGINSRQKAEAYLYLGGAEGYIGIFEYGKGHIFSALINGFQADDHLEEALFLDPEQVDAYFGLGLYRYGNSRLGGISNLLMQAGRDLRQVGLDHIEHAISHDSRTMPLALKTLTWFYISEQINPDNADLPPDNLLSRERCRKRTLELFRELEVRYFEKPPYRSFPGNKEIALMKAVQFVLDGEYQKAQTEFSHVLEICRFLQNEKNLAINPQLVQTVEAAIKFCDLMLAEPDKNNEQAVRSVCLQIDEQVTFLNSGGTMIEYDSKKIRGELHGVFAKALNGLSKKQGC